MLKVMRKWTWRNIEFALPQDWEMLEFSRNPEQGKCLFADRNQYRFKLTWRKTPSCPNFEKAFADHLKNLQERGIEAGKLISSGEWYGLYGEMNGKRFSQFGRYVYDESCALDTTFLWHGDRDKKLESAILAEIKESCQDQEGRLPWRAFGMTIRVPRRWKLEKCTVDPGLTAMTFCGEKGSGGEVRFERRGVLKHWLKEPVESWFKRYAQKELGTVEESKTVENSGHQKTTIKGKAKGFLSRKKAAHGEAWICPEDEHLYSIIGWGNPDTLEKCSLECCGNA